MNVEIFNLTKFKKTILVVIVIITILLCILPMSLSPIWNGTNPEHRNQYEVLADSFLEGHLYFNYQDIDERLLDMDNPYDPEERDDKEVDFHWDHSFYNGKYYMYFGVAPVILTFIPYKIITGHSLISYHATQLYTALFIIGMFTLFYNVCKYLFKETNFSIYLFMSSALSILSVWICVDCPSLYCTAISSGLCMAIWSLYFYTKAVYGDYSLNKAILLATIGGLFGALVFACRPPIGLVNILTIPLLITFLKKYGFNIGVIKKVLIVLIPYIIIASLLMTYNYVRFHNVFEFGQSYQLTIDDQRNLSSKINFNQILDGLYFIFLEHGDISSSFPYISIAGIFVNFPVLVIPYLLWFSKKFRRILAEKNIKWLYLILMITPLLVALMDTMSATDLMARYRLDEYFLLSILTFISAVCLYSMIFKDKKKHILKGIIITLSSVCILTCLLLFFFPDDCNYTGLYPEINTSIDEKINSIFK